MSDAHSTTSFSPLYMFHGRGAYQDLVGAALAGEAPPHATLPPVGPAENASNLAWAAEGHEP